MWPGSGFDTLESGSERQNRGTNRFGTHHIRSEGRSRGGSSWEVPELVRDLLSEEIPTYVVNGVTGPLRSQGEFVSQEVFTMVDMVANDAETAMTVCGVAKQNLLNFPYPGRLPIGGNLAFPFIPKEILVGNTYKFNVYHLMEVDNLLALFPVELYNNLSNI